MKLSRRAARRGTMIGSFSVAGMLLAAGSAAAVVAGAMARRVVTPAAREADVNVLGVDAAAQTITLGRTPDTALPGRYGLRTTGDPAYVKIGTVLRADDRTVTRKLLTEVADPADIGTAAEFSGWYYDRPDQLHLPFDDVSVPTPAGDAPAWLFPSADTDDAAGWVILVHGRGGRREECLRAVPVYHALGLTCLVVSYRNDGDAPRADGGRYGLGVTEAADVDAAIVFARERGARRVVLAGWSMGGAIVLQTALDGEHADVIAGLVLDSPAIDWREILAYQARLTGLPAPLRRLAVRTLGSARLASLAGVDRIPWERLDVVHRVAELRHPVLILHSDDDGFVPSGGSHAFAAARPDLVTLESFSVARHTKLWNVDPGRWARCVSGWVRRLGLSATPDGQAVTPPSPTP